ncbi:MAG TPA: type III-B CRISPR module-associated protein Cmr5 [Acidobacteriota bacterium]|nr:type III-B CRISPR module-associated protein Cmr5 [Acidobacteriota bacterium]
MKNLEQIRAMNALEAVKRIEKHDKKGKGDKGGDVLTGFPALILNNGLLATIAFCKSKSKSNNKSGHELICDELAVHLAHNDIHLLNPEQASTDGLLEHLTSNGSDRLRLCTTETMTYLNYLRRFAKSVE